MFAENPQPAIIRTHHHQGRELDVQTLDRGGPHHCIVTSVFSDGQLLATRTVPYLPGTTADAIREFMLAHNTRVATEVMEAPVQAEPAAAVPAPPEPAPAPLEPAPAGRAEVQVQPAVPGQPRAIVMVFEQPRDFLEVHFTRGKQSGVLVESPEDVALGTPVELMVRFRGPPLRQFQVSGVVAWKRHRGGGALRPGFGVDLPAAQRVPLDHVVDFALGIHDAATLRKHPRVRCHLPVTLQLPGGGTRQEVLKDVSAGGAYVATPNPLPQGTELRLALKTRAWWLPTNVRARVVWTRPGDGMGVQFLFDGPREEARLQALATRLMAA